MNTTSGVSRIFEGERGSAGYAVWLEGDDFFVLIIEQITFFSQWSVFGDRFVVGALAFLY